MSQLTRGEQAEDSMDCAKVWFRAAQEEVRDMPPSVQPELIIGLMKVAAMDQAAIISQSNWESLKRFEHSQHGSS